MGRVFIYPQENPSEAGLNIDVTSKEMHSKTNTITTHSIEKGSDITDNIKVNPDELTLECVISDDRFQLATMLSGISKSLRPNIINTAAMGDFLQPFSKTVYDYLTELRNEKKLLIVDTSYELYEDMVIESFTTPKDSNEAIFFTLKLVKIKFAYSSTSDKLQADSANSDSAATQKNEGKKPPKPASDEKSSQGNKSIAKTLFE